MINIQGIKLIEGSNEELLPDFSPDFPYIATCAKLDKYIYPMVPWHWHSTVELFYMESGCLEYTTPNGKWVFPAGSGGFGSSSYFGKVFRERFGCSPAEYRKKWHDCDSLSHQ